MFEPLIMWFSIAAPACRAVYATKCASQPRAERGSTVRVVSRLARGLFRRRGGRRGGWCSAGGRRRRLFAGRRTRRCAGSGLGLRGLGQRQRLVGIRVEVGDHIRALMCVGDAGERHERARYIGARIGQPGIERIEGPGAALGLQRCGIVEACLRRDLPADDAVKIGADLVCPGPCRDCGTARIPSRSARRS